MVAASRRRFGGVSECLAFVVTGLAVKSRLLPAVSRTKVSPSPVFVDCSKVAFGLSGYFQ